MIKISFFPTLITLLLLLCNSPLLATNDENDFNKSFSHIGLNQNQLEDELLSTSQQRQVISHHNDENYLEFLSDEVILYLFSFLNPLDIRRVSLSNVRMHGVSQESSLWKHYGIRMRLLLNDDITSLDKETITVQFLLIKASLAVALGEIESHKLILFRIAKKTGKYPQIIPIINDAQVHKLTSISQRRKRRKFIKKVADVGCPWALDEKLCGILFGNMGYSQNFKQGKELVRNLFLQNHPWAQEKKLEGLMFRTNGYKRNPRKADRLFAKFIALGNEGALERQLSLHLRSQSQHDKTAKRFVNKWVAINHPWALRKKFEGRINGTNGFRKKPQSAKAFLAKLADQGIPWALEEQYNSLKYGYNEFEEDVNAAQSFLDQWYQQGHPWAVEKRLIEEFCAFQGLPTSLVAKEFIDSEFDTHFSVKSVKAAGCLFGLFGFRKNKKLASELISDYNIALFDMTY